MQDLRQLIESGSAHVWLYIPVAIFLGALHGLEPGHSKTMMAAFIIAIRGTVWQAVLLGVSAAISHSLLIWLLAGLALYYGNQWNAETTEPYLQLISAALILGLALWMFVRTRREMKEAQAHGHHHHHHEEKGEEEREVIHLGRLDLASLPANPAGCGLILPPGYSTPASLGSGPKRGAHAGLMLDTGHGWLEVCITETGADSRFRVYPCRASGEAVPLPKGTAVSIEASWVDGRVQKFNFQPKADCWEAASALPKPHVFTAIVSLGHSGHAHTYRLRFTGDSQAGQIEEPTPVLEAGPVEYQDAHERAHAQDIARRFGNRPVTNLQIMLFGITGGLIPCPAAFTILLVCLQIGDIPLGFALVASFDIGLALTMVSVGAVAAWGVRHAERRVKGFSEWMRRAPYISCALLVLLAGFMAWQGWHGLSGHGH